MTVSIGDQVRLIRTPTFLKTADPMPMLRPPDLVTTDEVGLVTVSYTHLRAHETS